MNNYNEINLIEFEKARNSGDCDLARKMLDGSYEDIFKAYPKVSAEFKGLYGLKIKNVERLKKLSSNRLGLRMMVGLLELITNDGIMVSQLNNSEGI